MESVKIWIQVGGWRAISCQTGARRAQRLAKLVKGVFRAVAPRGCLSVSGSSSSDRDASVLPHQVLVSAVARLHSPDTSDEVLARLLDIPGIVPCLIAVECEGEDRRFVAGIDVDGLSSFEETVIQVRRGRLWEEACLRSAEVSG